MPLWGSPNEYTSLLGVQRCSLITSGAAHRGLRLARLLQAWLGSFSRRRDRLKSLTCEVTSAAGQPDQAQPGIQRT